MIISETVLLPILKELLNIQTDITPQSPFNLFEYDSFTKVNIIIAIEMYAETDAVDFDALIACDTFQDVMDLADTLKVGDGHKV